MDKKQETELFEMIGFIKNHVVKIDEKLEHVDERLTGVETRLTAVEGVTNAIYNRLDNEVDKRGKLEVRVKALEKAK